jgi:hypothetical protein
LLTLGVQPTRVGVINHARWMHDPLERAAHLRAQQPSAVNSVICVSSVIDPAGHTPSSKLVTPRGPNRRRISSRLMNSTGAPKASPTAPPRRQPRKRVTSARALMGPNLQLSATQDLRTS